MIEMVQYIVCGIEESARGDPLVAVNMLYLEKMWIFLGRNWHNFETVASSLLLVLCSLQQSMPLYIGKVWITVLVKILFQRVSGIGTKTLLALLILCILIIIYVQWNPSNQDTLQ